MSASVEWQIHVVMFLSVLFPVSRFLIFSMSKQWLFYVYYMCLYVYNVHSCMYIYVHVDEMFNPVFVDFTLCRQFVCLHVCIVCLALLRPTHTMHKHNAT